MKKVDIPNTLRSERAQHPKWVCNHVYWYASCAQLAVHSHLGNSASPHTIVIGQTQEHNYVEKNCTKYIQKTFTSIPVLWLYIKGQASL